jgi:GNAT superfamily N-acetyltransferase
MIEIQEAVIDDAEQMARVNAAGWREGYRGIVPDDRLDHLPEADWERQMRAGLSEPRLDSFTRTAELDGEFAGYCFVAAPGRDQPDESNVAELVAIYVEPRLWRRGVGRALIGAAIDHTAELSYECLLLWTFEQNQRALGFYRAAGFEPDGARRPFVPIGTPTIRMRRMLS